VNNIPANLVFNPVLPVLSVELICRVRFPIFVLVILDC